MKLVLSSAALGLLLCAPLHAGALYDRGVELYNGGRYSDATESFEQAIKKKDRTKEATEYIERIRRETVERIRNKALTGISKASWQSKYYFMHAVDNRVRVGISAQEVFDRQSVNFRSGAIEALAQVADAIAKSDNNQVDIELINETNQDVQPNKELIAQQIDAVFSYLSLAARGALPKY